MHTLAAASVGFAAVVVALGGCYERVVAARGPGADQYKISEPYQEDSALDRWIFGDSDRDPYQAKPGIRTE